MVNWYKEAQTEKQPYQIVLLLSGQEKVLKGNVWAYSSEQARTVAIKKHSKLGDYLEMGYEIIARFDKEKWEEIQRANESKEQMKEEQIQDAWWNK